MSLHVCVLASGSSANCIYIASETTRILIDAGLSGKETARRLEQVGADIAGIHALCVTHEHDDHCSGLRVLHRRFKTPLYANAGTIKAIEAEGPLADVSWQVFATGSPFEIGDLHIEPFSVPHDSYDPVGFVVSGGGQRIGIATDLGMSTTLIRQRLANCHALVLEANHDEGLLKDSKRPWSIKQRILSGQGHLSNAQAAELLAEVAGPQLRAAFLVHLSAECNTPELAVRTIRKELEKRGHGHVELKPSHADRVSDVLRLG
jgi:phosphoribosyl 1,2-cyclic phosphodiesterase